MVAFGKILVFVFLSVIGLSESVSCPTSQVVYGNCCYLKFSILQSEQSGCAFTIVGSGVPIELSSNVTEVVPIPGTLNLLLKDINATLPGFINGSVQLDVISGSLSVYMPYSEFLVVG